MLASGCRLRKWGAWGGGGGELCVSAASAMLDANISKSSCGTRIFFNLRDRDVEALEHSCKGQLFDLYSGASLTGVARRSQVTLTLSMTNFT